MFLPGIFTSISTAFESSKMSQNKEAPCNLPVCVCQERFQIACRYQESLGTWHTPARLPLGAAQGEAHGPTERGEALVTTSFFQRVGQCPFDHPVLGKESVPASDRNGYRCSSGIYYTTLSVFPCHLFHIFFFKKQHNP